MDLCGLVRVNYPFVLFSFFLVLHRLWLCYYLFIHMLVLLTMNVVLCVAPLFVSLLSFNLFHIVGDYWIWLQYSIKAKRVTQLGMQVVASCKLKTWCVFELVYFCIWKCCQSNCLRTSTEKLFYEKKKQNSQTKECSY